jgi:hypothetical protein
MEERIMKTAIAILILTSGLLAAEDNYERSRECAVQAEKSANSRDGRVLERNHYSPKYQRCFMLTRNREYGGPRDHYVEGHEVTVWRLNDAFENHELAYKMLFEHDNKTACAIGAKLTPCPEYEAYVQEHLSQ